MTSHVFEVSVEEDALTSFAALSGDWNPLHTDPTYAAATPYRHRVLHGAYTAGLVSRMAGMHLPGKECLLHSMRLKFIAPMVPPLTLRVEGRVERQTEQGGYVSVEISNAADGRRHVEAQYSFGYHSNGSKPIPADAVRPRSEAHSTQAIPEKGFVLVSGASGALGTALHEVLGERMIPLSRSDSIQTEEARTKVRNELGPHSVSGAVHCGWPWPDNRPLIELEDSSKALSTGLAEPLAQAIGMAALLRDTGRPGATLALVGSTVGNRGRHMWRAPVYSLGKASLPTLAQILGMELSAHDRRCVCVTFDTLSGGMSEQLSAAAKVALIDKSPWGRLMTMAEAADAISWVMDSSNRFISGATVDMSGCTIP